MLLYVTGNNLKFDSAKTQLAKFGVDIEQKVFDIVEIQSESIEKIAIDKARKAFEIAKQPLIVNDSSWYFPGLNGFPGPFMKYMNDWFSAEDFLNLLRDKSDKTVILKQVVVYIDGKREKIFEYDLNGKVLENAAKVEGLSGDKITSFREDGLSLAQEHINYKRGAKTKLWEDFAKWYKERFSATVEQ